MKTEIPEGYKNSPVGIIPEEWEVKRLEEIAEIKSGTTPLRSIEDFFLKGNIPWVKTTDLNNGLLYETEEKVTQKALDETSLRILPKGTVLVAMYGGFNQIGRTALLTLDATINQALSALLLNKTIADNLFILYWLNHNVGSWKRYAASSRKDPNITSRDVALFQTPIPPLNEQQQIAKILSMWDVVIEKQTLLIEKLELRKRGLMQQLLTGKKRLKGFDGEWKNLELCEILKYEQPTKYLVKDTNYNDKYNTPVLTAGKTFILGYTNEKENIFNELPVIIFDDFTTEMKYVEFPFKAKSSAMKVLHSKGNCNLKFIYESMQMIEYQIGGHERHWISKYSYLTIKIPSTLEQDNIAEILSTADQGIHVAKEKLEQLKKQKKGLMQVLLTGKKRVITTTNTQTNENI